MPADMDTTEPTSTRTDAEDARGPAPTSEPRAATQPPPSLLDLSTPPRTSRPFSFAELWPDGEHDTVREVEAAIAGQEYPRAVELCEALVARVLASAAGLFGTSDAPRDPALIPILLGLNGSRYLAFRATVREARGGTPMTSREALSAFAFAVDARLARSSIR
jgi:mutual gliding-motility protein MglA